MPINFVQNCMREAVNRSQNVASKIFLPREGPFFLFFSFGK